METIDELEGVRIKQFRCSRDPVTWVGEPVARGGLWNKQNRQETHTSQLKKETGNWNEKWAKILNKHLKKLSNWPIGTYENVQLQSSQANVN